MSENKFSRGKIYKLVSNKTDKCYIGSTIEHYLCTRMAHHRDDKKFHKQRNHKPVSSSELIQFNDCKIILIENYPCKTKKQLRAREQYHIDKTKNCVNRYCAKKCIKKCCKK